MVMGVVGAYNELTKRMMSLISRISSQILFQGFGGSFSTSHVLPLFLLTLSSPPSGLSLHSLPSSKPSSHIYPQQIATVTVETNHGLARKSVEDDGGIGLMSSWCLAGSGSWVKKEGSRKRKVHLGVIRGGASRVDGGVVTGLNSVFRSWVMGLEFGWFSGFYEELKEDLEKAYVGKGNMFRSSKPFYGKLEAVLSIHECARVDQHLDALREAAKLPFLLLDPQAPDIFIETFQNLSPYV
ncbi:hypothetical protein Droror1_Dr00023985 [Drosera rotundifolia]